MNRSLSLLAALCSLPLTAALAAGAPGAGTAMGSTGSADVNKEISTALTHAQMAAASGDVKMVQQHLHHMVNCLVGDKSPDFDAAEENPCKGQGNGAMNDVDAKSDKHKKLDKALSEAKEAFKKKDAKGAQSEAKEAIKDLQDAQKTK
jgi:hypothetical protein